MKKEDLKLKTSQYNDEVEIFVEGDVNDADYISKTAIVSLEEFEEILPALRALELAEDLDDLNPRLADILWEYNLFPSTEDICMHSLEGIKVWFLSKDDNIKYEVEL